MDTILVEKRAGVACITLNRPHVRNAISLEMAEELRQTVSACEEDDAVKVLVFTGMGDSFISGGDLRQFMQARGREQAQPILDRVAGGRAAPRDRQLQQTDHCDDQRTRHRGRLRVCDLLSLSLRRRDGRARLCPDWPLDHDRMGRRVALAGQAAGVQGAGAFADG